MDNDSAIYFELIKFEDRYAVLKNSDEKIGTILWPIEKLPKNIKIGEKLKLAIENENVQNEKQYEIMRKLLEELVN